MPIQNYHEAVYSKIYSLIIFSDDSAVNPVPYTPYLQISPNDPVYLALYEAIKRDIAEGKLRPHERLPSIRALAKQLSLSTTPVDTAYQQLIAEGYLESRPRQGVFVVPLPDSIKQLKLPDEPPPASKGHSAGESGPSIVYDFHLSKNDLSPFPLRIWSRLLHHTLLKEYEELFHYGDPQGEAGLREELAAYLYRFRGVICRREQIVIGAEQHLLMHFLAVMLRGFSSGIAVENPCYPLIPSVFQEHGYEVIPLTEADQGIAVSRLQRTPARVIAAAPSYQFPGGRVMPLSERLELLQWAKENQAYLIEDDYGGEFRYQSQPIAALQGLDPQANVIYLGGFSQILAPDVCIHYMVLPETLLEPYHAIKRRLLFEMSSSRIYQRTLQKFMEQGYFEKHVRKMRTHYRRKNRKLAEILETQFQGIGQIVNPDAGLHLVLKLRASATEQEMVDAARDHGIHVAAASPFYTGEIPPSAEREFIIGFGGIEWERMDEGVRRLREVWEDFL